MKSTEIPQGLEKTYPLPATQKLFPTLCMLLLHLDYVMLLDYGSLVYHGQDEPRVMNFPTWEGISSQFVLDKEGRLCLCFLLFVGSTAVQPPLCLDV